jgi:hypothetical protein
MTTTRREFLVGAASSIATAVLVAPGCGDSNPQRSKKDDTSKPPSGVELDALPETQLGLDVLVDGFFEGADGSAIRTIGREYVRRFDQSDEVLADMRPVVEAVADIDDETRALTTLDETVVEDFEHVETTSVGGWQLARTECRLCALAYYLDEER